MIEAVNLKTGARYRILYYATDCTNSRDGTPVVVYANENALDRVFVRDLVEFEKKFEVC